MWVVFCYFAADSRCVKDPTSSERERERDVLCLFESPGALQKNFAPSPFLWVVSFYNVWQGFILLELMFYHLIWYSNLL